MQAKLVRDNIPGGRPANSAPGRHLALCLKLHEEAQEIADCPTDPEEYADLLEVMLQLARDNGVRWEDIEAKMLEKRAKKGGFQMCMVRVRDDGKDG